MIKITYIIGRLSYGGAEKLLLDLCRKIDKTKFEITVAVLQENNPMKEDFEAAGVHLEFFNKTNKLDIDVLRRLADYLREVKPDIVHTHLFAGDFWGGRAAELAGVKHLISTKHDMMSQGFWRDRLGRVMRRKFDRVVAISDAVRTYLIDTEKISIEKVALIYNGVDVNRFYRPKSRILQGEGLRIGTVGRLSKEKGQKHLIRACRFLPEGAWDLTVVGEGPLRAELRDLVDFLGLQSSVKFTGQVEDVRKYLNEFDVFVLPSISEGLSLALLEAALAGAFIIATNVGGVPEIIRDRETGLLFKPKNIEQLLAHLRWVDDHREEARRLARALQAEVAEKFSIYDVVKRYEAVYAEVLKNSV